MRKTIITVAVVSLTMGGAVLIAAPAHARPLPPSTPAQVWTQSFERASQGAPCVAPAYLDIPWQADWNPAEQAWIPTWEQWPNGGTGGWTCFRQITWAKGNNPELFD